MRRTETGNPDAASRVQLEIFQNRYSRREVAFVTVSELCFCLCQKVCRGRGCKPQDRDAGSH